jgi:uncharacterized protein YecE (DUF72 family)
MELDRNVTWFLGTIGFAYPHWADKFYPHGLRANERLEYFASRFNVIELDTTFHAIPSTDVVRRWASVTPKGFRFCVKTPRDVTHGSEFARAVAPDHLLRIPTFETMQRFLDAIENLGEKLAIVLLQFPRTFRADHCASLFRFLEHFSRHARMAVEFRHESWWTQAIADLLRERGIAWVATDQTPRYRAARVPVKKCNYLRPIISTTDFLYVRWLGQHDQFPDRRKEHFDPTARLTWWADRLRDVLIASPRQRTIYAFFDNDFTGHAPTTLQRFADCIDLPLMHPAAMDQPMLFRA